MISILVIKTTSKYLCPFYEKNETPYFIFTSKYLALICRYIYIRLTTIGMETHILKYISYIQVYLLQCGRRFFCILWKRETRVTKFKCFQKRSMFVIHHSFFHLKMTNVSSKKRFLNCYFIFFHVSHICFIFPYRT